MELPWFTMKFFSDAGFKALVGDAGSLSSQYSLNVLQRFLELGKQATYDENTRTWSLPAHVKQVATTWATRQGTYVATAQEQVEYPTVFDSNQKTLCTYSLSL